MTSGLKVRHHFSSRSKNISLTTSLFVTQLWRLKSVRVGTPWPSGPLTRWVAFHWVLWTLQLDKHSMVHSACLAAVWSARPRQDPWLQSICCPIATSAALPLLCRKIKKASRENMTSGSCALCPAGYKSQLYGGPWQGLGDLCAPSFPFSHQEHRTIFRCGDHSEVGGEKRGRGGRFSHYLRQWRNRQATRKTLWTEFKRAGGLIKSRFLSF